MTGAPGPGRLPPGHDCRRDDPGYASVHDWWQDHHGRVPIQAAAGLDRYVREHGVSFGEAFRALTGPRGPIILIQESSDAPPPGTSRRRGRPARSDQPEPTEPGGSEP
jgi:hypothetical protein